MDGSGDRRRQAVETITASAARYRFSLMKAWSLTEIDVHPHRPLVLDSADEGRLIAIDLPAGEEMREHRVHERAWLVVASGAVQIDGADGETVRGGSGLVAEFDPNESRAVRATEDARLLLVLAPWPGVGHPSHD
jgi:redox-sensitive bicupin YhaK (pirin superfamily)